MGKERIVSKTKEHVILAIRKYSETYLKEPKWRIHPELFKLISYNRWAVDEMIRCIEESDSVSPISLIEDFSRKMDRLSWQNHKTSMIFSTAHDMADNVLDMLLTMKFTDRKERR